MKTKKMTFLLYLMVLFQFLSLSPTEAKEDKKVFSNASAGASQNESLSPPDRGADTFTGPPIAPKDPPNADKLREEFEREQDKMLEQMKHINPKAYEEQKGQIERQRKISSVLKDYYDHKISDNEAERKLKILLEEDIKKEILLFDGQIQQLEKKLAFLRKAKADPSILLKKRIDRLLGKHNPLDSDDSQIII